MTEEKTTSEDRLAVAAAKALGEEQSPYEKAMQALENLSTSAQAVCGDPPASALVNACWTAFLSDLAKAKDLLKKQTHQVVDEVLGEGPKPETHFMWKEYATVEGCENDGPRLLTPFGDPDQYEQAMDFYFKTAEEAVEYLETWETAKEAAMADGWVLVSEVATPVGILGSDGKLKPVV